MASRTQDKAGKAYWDEVWRHAPPPLEIDPARPGPRNVLNRRMHALFGQIFAPLGPAPGALLEIGCGRSVWLPYFAKWFGFRVAGMDYSEIGCEQARHILRAAGLSAEIVCADVFSPPSSLQGAFDVVCSFGVAEHFQETEVAIAAFATFLKPGGMMVTQIPNLSGTVGLLTRVFNRPVYECHVPLTADDLRLAHQRAGLEVLGSRYFLSTGFGIVNLEGLDPRLLRTRLKAHVLRWLSRLSAAIWIAEDYTWELPVGRTWSPYIVCVARKAVA